MARWSEIASEQPEFAARVQALFDAHKHKVLATLRKDGSPRVSGIEANFEDGDIWMGSSPAARKAIDLARDPRLALHCTSDDPPADPAAWPGDAKVAGRAVIADDPKRLQMMSESADGPVVFYRIDIEEVVLTKIGDPPDYLQVEVWTPDKGLRLLRAT